MFAWNSTEGTVEQLFFTVPAITEKQLGRDLQGASILKRSVGFLARKLFPFKNSVKKH